MPTSDAEAFGLLCLAVLGCCLAMIVRAWWTGPIVRAIEGLRRDLRDRR